MIQKIKLFIGRVCVRIIKFLGRKAKLDLIKIGYAENGITKSYNYDVSGENHFIFKELHKLIKSENPIFLDVGANKGDYASMLNESFPKATIYSFEPNPSTFAHLEKRSANKFNVINKGIGTEKGILDLYFDKDDETSVQATSDPEILKTIAKTENIISQKIDVITLDEFCMDKDFNSVDLLKIDTEGFELEALQGAKEMLSKNAIKIIQFEFNEVNIVKRRFLKDFYDILPGFSFYRLDENRMIPLNDWEPKHEIFMFQNIVAIKD